MSFIFILNERAVPSPQKKVDFCDLLRSDEIGFNGGDFSGKRVWGLIFLVSGHKNSIFMSIFVETKTWWNMKTILYTIVATLALLAGGTTALANNPIAVFNSSNFSGWSYNRTGSDYQLTTSNIANGKYTTHDCTDHITQITKLCINRSKNICKCVGIICTVI